jgi:hypothetical protein
VESRGVRCDVRRRRRQVRRHARSRTDCSRRVSTVRIRNARRAGTTSAMSGRSPRIRRRAKMRRRSRRAHCWW